MEQSDDMVDLEPKPEIETELRSPTLLTSPITTSTEAKGGTAERHLDLPPQASSVTDQLDPEIDASVLVTQDVISQTSPSYVMTGSDSARTLPTYLEAPIMDRAFTHSPISVISLPCLSPDPTNLTHFSTGRSRSHGVEEIPDSKIRPLKKRRLDLDDGRSGSTHLIGSTSSMAIVSSFETPLTITGQCMASDDLEGPNAGSSSLEERLCNVSGDVYADGDPRFGVKHVPLIFVTYPDGTMSCRLCMCVWATSFSFVVLSLHLMQSAFL